MLTLGQNLEVTSKGLKDRLATVPLTCQHFGSDDTGKEYVEESMNLELQDRISGLNLYTRKHKAVAVVENPIIFSRPGTEGRFLSQKV